MAAPMALMAAARDPQWSRLLIPLLHPLSRTCSSGPGPGPDPARQRLHKERRRLRREAAMEARSGGGGDKNGGGTEPRKWTEPPVFTYDVPTPPGEKKDTTVPLPKSYSPRYVEAAWYSWWEKEGFFTPEYHAQLPHREDATFAMCMPPPNVTGSLHLGHALTVAIQDAIVRWNRMRGRRVLWVPGCDHAGIATQVVVEQRLQRESGISRRDLTRDQFLQHVWRWKHEKGDEIYQQLRLLGSSLDWQRARFTMEAGYSEAVTEAFVRLYEAGLVYRGRQLVNWSCALGSAISDIEVESCPLKGRTLVSVPGYQEKVVFGELAHLAYPTEDGGGEVVVATTRPETVPGDVAVAVNPDDPRYSHLHGVRVRHPLTGHLLPVITDLLVDPDFGTGAVKVSPGHDHTDHQLAKRHQLPLLTVITDTGHMAANCPPWLQGMARFDARRAVMSAFTDSGLFRGSRDHPMVLRLCSRSRDVVEPLLRSQWFVRCKEMAASAMEAVDRGDLTFTPASLKSNWNIWLSNISDWCVSRQLWWGHRIPAYRVALPGSPPVQEVVGSDWVVGRSEVEARRIAARSLGVDENDITLTQDADVLDTWFSSALFPFAAMGWPRKTDDLCSFYPNSLLETGTDLLFFWVARMVMLGERVTGSLPFPQVLFHPLLRDSHGRKMSKSLGNVIDPRHLITGSSLQHLQEDLSHKHLHPREKQLVLEGQRRNFPHGIPECGTDAMRLTLCSRGHGEDVSVDVSSFLSARRFCNKMWNAVRFTLSSLPPDLQPLPPHQVRPEAAIDRWALGCLHSAVGACERGFLQKDLSMVTTAARHYWQHQLCDVYLECVKAVLQGSVRGDAEMGVQVLLLCVEGGLRLLAPLMPFLTEELWQRLPPTPHKLYPSISIAPYPSLTHTPDWSCREVELDFELVQEVVRAVRGVRAEYRLTREKPYLFVSGPPEISARLQPFLEPLQTLSRAGGVELLPPREGPPSGTVHAVVTHTCRVHLMLQGGVDPQTERARLADQRRRLEAELATAEGRSHGDGFTEKVPERVRSEQNSKMSALRAQLEWISEVERGLGEPGDRP